MTTGDLIRLLQEVDPTGTTPVCVDNIDVHYVTRTEAYWDGRLQQLVRDDAGQLVGARIVTHGHKVRIYTQSVEDLLLDQPDLPVEMVGTAARDADTVEGWRAEGRALR